MLSQKLQVIMEAATDAATPLNLAQHTYFNLNGQANGTVLDHILELNACAALHARCFTCETSLLEPALACVPCTRSRVPCQVSLLRCRSYQSAHNTGFRMEAVALWEARGCRGACLLSR